jgi:phosphatidylglycerol:prolipoprotein diacylglycerol transferase
MNPVLIDIGPLTIHSYGFFIAAGFLLGLSVAMHQAKQRGLDHKLVPDLGFYIILSAIVGSRLLYVLLEPAYFLDNPLQILQFWKGGLVFLGGALLAALVCLLVLRRKNQPFWPWADAFAPGIAAGQAVGRLGCLMAGCCYGKACSLPWSITFTQPNSLAPINVPLHPTQVYHSLAGLITLCILLLARKKMARPGELFALFLVLYSMFRFVIEFFRGDFRGYLGFLSVTQWVSAALFMAGLTLIIKARRS